MNRGFLGVLLFIVFVAAVTGGIVWWALNQDSITFAVPAVSPSVETHTIPVIFTYSANDSEFPLGVFQLTGGTRVLGADYVRARNTARAVYLLLGADAGVPLTASCHWVVGASIEIANPALDINSYAYMSPMPTVVAANLLRVVSKEAPRQVCKKP